MNQFILVFLLTILSINTIAQMPNTDEMGQAKLRLREIEKLPNSYVKDRKSTRLNSSHSTLSRMPSSA